MSHWDHQIYGRRGSYVVRRNGQHVLGVEMIAEVPIPSVLMERVTAAVSATLEEYEAQSNRRRAELDAEARRLGWDDRAQHDVVFDELRAVCRGYPVSVQGYLRRRWSEHKFVVPLGLVDMDEWDRIVRSAPRVVAQDVAAEGSTVESEVA